MSTTADRPEAQPQCPSRTARHGRRERPCADPREVLRCAQDDTVARSSDRCLSCSRTSTSSIRTGRKRAAATRCWSRATPSRKCRPSRSSSSTAQVIDCGKRTLMPGLIDCHVHTHHSEVYINRMEAVPLTLMMARSAGRLKRMLDRGFTTVRDAGGADWGTKTAVEIGPDPRPAHVHLLPLDRPDRRPQRPQPAHRYRPALPVLQRHGLHPLHRRRSRRGAQGGARADAPGRGPGEADGLGRRRLALRSAGIDAVHRSRRSPPRSRRRRPSAATC